MAKKEKIPTAKDLDEKLNDSYRRWKDLYLNGGSDPFWHDGVNLNLIRNHIMSYRKEIEENLKFWDYPDSYFLPLPVELPSNYMAVGRKVCSQFTPATGNPKPYKECLKFGWNEAFDEWTNASIKNKKRGQFYIMTHKGLIKVYGYIVRRAGMCFGIHQNTRNSKWNITLLSCGARLLENENCPNSVNKAIEILNNYDLDLIRERKAKEEKTHDILRSRIREYKKNEIKLEAILTSKGKNTGYSFNLMKLRGF